MNGEEMRVKKEQIAADGYAAPLDEEARIDAVAAEILMKYKKAFEELAK